jgi:hypothetical protein
MNSYETSSLVNLIVAEWSLIAYVRYLACRASSQPMNFIAFLAHQKNRRLANERVCGLFSIWIQISTFLPSFKIHSLVELLWCHHRYRNHPCLPLFACIYCAYATKLRSMYSCYCIMRLPLKCYRRSNIQATNRDDGSSWPNPNMANFGYLVVWERSCRCIHFDRQAHGRS